MAAKKFSAWQIAWFVWLFCMIVMGFVGVTGLIAAGGLSLLIYLRLFTRILD